MAKGPCRQTPAWTRSRSISLSLEGPDSIGLLKWQSAPKGRKKKEISLWRPTSFQLVYQAPPVMSHLSNQSLLWGQLQLQRLWMGPPRPTSNTTLWGASHWNDTLNAPLHSTFWTSFDPSHCNVQHCHAGDHFLKHFLHFGVTFKRESSPFKPGAGGCTFMSPCSSAVSHGVPVCAHARVWAEEVHVVIQLSRADRLPSSLPEAAARGWDRRGTSWAGCLSAQAADGVRVSVWVSACVCKTCIMDENKTARNM